MTRFIDLNADAGEGPDADSDLPLLEVLTSVSIACGTHAGGPATISRLSEAAAARGVGVGAHPGLASGRKARTIEPGEAGDAVLAQVAEFRKHARAPLQHVKLHGALYHAARDSRVAGAVIDAFRTLEVPILVAQAGSPLERLGREAGLRIASEAFLDRAYQPDGTLVPRDVAGALLSREDAVASRAVQVALKNRVEAADGSEIAVVADTLCVHGDTPGAPNLARAARAELERAGVVLRPMGAV